MLIRDLASTLRVEKVVVVDESSTHLGLTPLYARAPRGQRAYAKTRRNYGKNVTLLSALRLGRMTAQRSSKVQPRLQCLKLISNTF